MKNNVKQVIIMRKDLNMRKGKIAAQAAHASMAVILNLMELSSTRYDPIIDADISRLGGFDDPASGDIIERSITLDTAKEKELAIHEWLSGSFTKICVSVNSEEELLAIHKQAQEAGIICSLIQDSGVTEFNGVPTYTAVAIGPALVDEINKITGDLKLL